MPWTRRNFLVSAGLGTAASTVVNTKSSAQKSTVSAPAGLHDLDDWEGVRAHFNLDPQYIHLAGLLLASHPASIHAAIEAHRRALDANPAHYVKENRQTLDVEVRRIAADYLGAQPNEIAFTDSTTMGVALVINGLQIRADQVMLTTDFDYYSTHESLRYKADRSGAKIQKIPLYKDIHTVSQDEIVDTLLAAVGPQTRIVTATWVHSSTGLKVPIQHIAKRLEEINANRDPADRALLLVDGVHGLGVEDATMESLNCDFFMAGTHKWMFAPRGSGLIWGNPRAQAAVTPTIPTFTWDGWGWGGQMTPGGFKPFEHQWAVAQAFALHLKMGKARVAKRLKRLSKQLKKGLAQMPHVTLYTPMEHDLSAAIICFDIEGLKPDQVVQKLRQHQIIASSTPYRPSFARLTPGVYNTSEEIERTLRVIQELRS